MRDVPIVVDCHGMTDKGNTRQRNEDQFLVADLRRGLYIEQASVDPEASDWIFGDALRRLHLVADGIGGQPEGELASSVAVSTIAHYMVDTIPWFYRLREDSDEDLLEELKHCLERCDAYLHGCGRLDPAASGMGTTVTMSYILWPRLYVVHAGHSRCYLMRGPRMEQLTTDHTFARRLEEEDVLPPEKAESSTWSKVLSKSVGGGPFGVDAEIRRVNLEPGDTVLLCTDGLTRQLSDDEIQDVLAESRSAKGAAKALVEAANREGGTDNVTVVVSRFSNP